MDAHLKKFRKEHACTDCIYFRKLCGAKKHCVFDYLPLDASEEDILLFF